MNIALVTTNLAGGGAEKAMLRLAAALAQRGESVRLILLEHRIEHALPAGVELHALTRPGERLSKGYIGERIAAWKLRRLYRRLGLSRGCLTVSTLPFADRVVARAGLAPAWFRIANTLSAEAAMLARGDPRKAARRIAAYRALYEGRQLVAVSDGVAADLRDALGLQRARIVRIYNGFDFAALREAAAQPEPDLPAEPFVLHVGRFMPQKRHDLLLEAWKLAGLPQRLVLLAADQPGLRALIERQGLAGRVTVAGFRPNPYPWMRAADLLVLCSDREGMPNALVEAMACGTRAVSTDCPSGPREVLRGRWSHGLVPCGDAPALARAMREALAGPRPGPEDLGPEFGADHMARAYAALASA